MTIGLTWKCHALQRMQTRPALSSLWQMLHVTVVERIRLIPPFEASAGKESSYMSTDVSTAVTTGIDHLQHVHTPGLAAPIQRKQSACSSNAPYQEKSTLKRDPVEAHWKSRTQDSGKRLNFGCSNIRLWCCRMHPSTALSKLV